MSPQSWFKVDVDFVENKKIEALSDRAFRFHVAALCYCARNLTDGHLSARGVKVVCAVLAVTSPARIKELVVAKLWSPDVAGDGFWINDYLDHQRSAAEARKSSDAGRANANARWDAKRTADGNADRIADGNAEKRREEKEQTQDQNLAAEPAATVTSLVVRKRDDCWDFVVELKGEPLQRQRPGYGRIAADLRALLEREPSGTDWATELRRRHRALAAQWGDDKATARSLVENWQIAGNAADGAVRGPKRELSIEERMWKHAHRQGGELDAG